MSKHRHSMSKRKHSMSTHTHTHTHTHKQQHKQQQQQQQQQRPGLPMLANAGQGWPKLAKTWPRLNKAGQYWVKPNPSLVAFGAASWPLVNMAHNKKTGPGWQALGQVLGPLWKNPAFFFCSVAAFFCRISFCDPNPGMFAGH